MKTIRTLLLGASVLLLAGWANATVLLNENFDGYADQAAFQVAWAAIGTVAPTSATLATDQASSPSQSIRVDGTATTGQQRNQRLFAESGLVDTSTSITFSFDFYDSAPAAAPYRQASNLQDSTAAAATGQLISMGLNNNQSAANSGGNFYMGRILGYSPPTTPDPDGGPTEGGTLGSGAFFKLNDFGTSPLRSLGWHNLKVVISTDDGISADFAFYVDNIFAEQVSNIGTAATLRSYDVIRLGSGVSNASNPSWYDNFMVEVTVVPEPSTWVLGLMGGLGILWRMRRRAA